MKNGIKNIQAAAYNGGRTVLCFFFDTFQMFFAYCKRAIITRSLYIFYPIFHCGLYCRAVNVTDNLCTKQGNSSIFGSKIRGL